MASKRRQKTPKKQPKTKLDTSCPYCGSETHTLFYDVWKCNDCGACGITRENDSKPTAEAVKLFRRRLRRDLSNEVRFTQRLGPKDQALSEPQLPKSGEIDPSIHTCRRRLPNDRELGLIRMIRHSAGQAKLEEFADKHEWKFCICLKVFVKSQWLREDLKVKAVLSVRYSKDLGKAVAFLKRIPRWLQGNRFRPRTEKTLRRITAMGDEVLYGCVWWPGHPDWLLGDMIGNSKFRTLWGRTAPLRSLKPHENASRLELGRMYSLVRHFVGVNPLSVGFGPSTATVEEMTRVYESAHDAYLGDSYEDTEIEYEQIDYLADGARYRHFFDLQKWTDEQVLNLEHKKAYEFEIAMEDASAGGLFEYITWIPERPNRFGRPSPRLDVCLPSPQHQYIDPTCKRIKQNAACMCWDALFSSNRKSRTTV
jgi:ribosomal protein L37AE/L43A